MTFDYVEYLAAKKSVDDRALNREVLDRLSQELRVGAPDVTSVVEIGAGLGTMVARLIERRLLTRADYTLLDTDAALLSASHGWLASWAAQAGVRVEASDDQLRLFDDAGLDWRVKFVESEVFRYLAQRPTDRFDLLVANAFLDLVDVPAILPQLFGLLRPSGLYWFSINFDGETIFEPGHADDQRLMGVYHRSMDERVRDGRPAGDSRTGRHLFQHLRGAGASILAAGASDWCVFADSGRYLADEQRFVGHILDTIDAELRRHADVDRPVLGRWLEVRREQLKRGELVYIAHQLDFCGRVPPLR